MKQPIQNLVAREAVSVPTGKRRIFQRDELIAQKLKRLWELKKSDLDLTQEDAAENLGITQSAFSQMLNCKMVIHTDMILKIALMLEVSPTRIDTSFYKRFDIQNNRTMKAFLALEIMKMSGSDQADLLSIVNKEGGDNNDSSNKSQAKKKKAR
jgi:plasmid maintenance system antidote protein VapI